MEWSEKNKVTQSAVGGISSSTASGGVTSTTNMSPRKNMRSDTAAAAATRRSCDNSMSEDQSATLPLLHLVRQLLRNASTQTLMRLQVNSYF